MEIQPPARELNDLLEREAPACAALLSALGRRLYLPKGIITQSAEARERAHRYNATIGIATEGKVPMHLPSLAALFNMEPREVFPYAPVAGLAELRRAWREKQLAENPALAGKACGLPIVTSALTHGLSVAARLFADPGDPVVLPAHFWGNYRLTFEVEHGARIVTYPLFDGARFNAKGLHKTLTELAGGHRKAIVILNFPNNPTGFTPPAADAPRIVEALFSAAESGLGLVVLCDDAYFGLFYDDDCLKESIFAHVAGAHPRILAVKLDGATKEAFAWGFRVGFLTFAAAGSGDLDAVHGALEEKALGAIRGSVSNTPQVSQSAVLRLLRSGKFEEERKRKAEILAERARRTREVLARPEYREAWTPYPFNSGYFMCVRIHEVDAERLRRHLLERYGVGVIAGGSDIRVAFSCIEREEIAEVFDCIYKAWKELRAG